MAIPQSFERRISRRKKLTGLLPGRLTMAKTKDVINGKPIDVSESGLGIISDVIMEVGTGVVLTTDDRILHFKIIWKEPDFGKADLFRFGLELNDKDLKINLEDIFEAAGCLV